MGLFSKLDRHSGLMGRMVDTVGANLGNALARGDLSGQELRNAVVPCTGCEGGNDCGQWLDDHGAGAAEPPAYCRNRDLLDRIKR